MMTTEDEIQELYEINDDPKRKEFLDDLFSFMQRRGTPINRLPIMAKSVLDLYELYNLVIARGGLVDVINKKLWQEIIKGLHLPSSITSAAFTLRTQYMKYLYPYECEKKNLSTPAELQAAIDGNRREGRRSSYGQYEAMQNQMQMPQMGRQSLSGSMQQLSPLALVTHAGNNQQAAAVAAAAAAAHQRLMAPSLGQVHNLVTHEFEQRVREYINLMRVKEEHNAMNNGSTAMVLSPQHLHHKQQQQQQHQHQRQRSQSPEVNDTLKAMEMSHAALWQIYSKQTTSPSISPPGGGNVNSGESPEISEAQCDSLNPSDLPPNMNGIKRELVPTTETSKHIDFHHQPPPAKRAGFPSSFYKPHGMSSAAAAAADYNYKSDHHDSDTDAYEENNDDDPNMTRHSPDDEPNKRQHSHGGAPGHANVHNDKSDDSAIENSPSTSGNNEQTSSPVSIKKIHLSKQTQPQNSTSNTNTSVATSAGNTTMNNSTSLDSFEALNLLSGMQFRVTRNGTNSNGEQELLVNLELNGIEYSGVLISNASNLATATSMTSVSTIDENNYSNNKNANNENNITKCSQKTGKHGHTNNNNSKETSRDLVVSKNLNEDKNELTMRNAETSSNSSATTTNTVTANGPSSSAKVLKDT